MRSALAFFFRPGRGRRQEDAPRLKKTRPASRAAVGRTKETAAGQTRGTGRAVAAVARRRAIDFLSSSRVYDISPRFDTTRNLSACHACLSRTAGVPPPPCPFDPSVRPSFSVPRSRAHRRALVRIRREDTQRAADAAWISRRSGNVARSAIPRGRTRCHFVRLSAHCRFVIFLLFERIIISLLMASLESFRERDVSVYVGKTLTRIKSREINCSL